MLATQTLWQRQPKTMRISVDGPTARGVCAKDVILAIIAKIGAAGAIGHVIEYAGSAIRALSMEARLTVCNMSIEAGARAGMVAPDDTTYAYLAGRPFAPAGRDWDDALARWRALPSDPGAASTARSRSTPRDIEPMVTWGTSPEDAVPITRRVPDPADAPRRRSGASRDGARTRLHGTASGRCRLTTSPIDRVFIGSCTNGRIEDLRSGSDAAGARWRAGVEAWVVPGSGLVKAQAEAEGLDRMFTRGRASSGGTQAARCASAQTATSCRPGSAAPRPRIATSTGGRARARART